MTDTVNKPPYYNREGAMETIDEMVLLFGIEETMSFCKLNAWKYRSRALMKNGIEDLEKSDWYLKKFKELDEKSQLLPATGDVDFHTNPESVVTPYIMSSRGVL